MVCSVLQSFNQEFAMSYVDLLVKKNKQTYTNILIDMASKKKKRKNLKGKEKKITVEQKQQKS